MVGRSLAHYEITAALGAGGMGEVYRATDTKLGRDVALKVLPAELASDPERLGRFRREAKVLAALDHPGIVTVYSVEEADGVHFLTMQLVDGQPLDRLIPQGGLPLEELLAIATALADALVAAHEKGVVHRDLKPANVMVGAGGRVKVLDFGIAKLSTPEETSGPELPTQLRTREGIAMGTVPYMSPEQVSGRDVDHRTDVFSLGVILYEMASGRRPFEGRSSVELASAILRDAPRPLGETRPDLPQDLERIIQRCLAKNAADRFPSARELRDALHALPGDSTPATGSGAIRAEEGFWVAVSPFKHGTNAELAPLAEGLSEEIVSGLSRFSYLKVTDIKIGARYVMEGSLRQAGSQIRVSVQLIDTATGAHLWAESYNRPFEPREIFKLQDDLVPRIVSAAADAHGVLTHAMSEALRGKAPGELTPYEAVLRSFGYGYRFSPEEHGVVRAALERAVQQAPRNSDAWAMLSLLYGEEHASRFNVRPDPLGRALEAARRAVDASPSNAVAHNALARAHFFRKEFQAFRTAADRAIALNPWNGPTLASLGGMMAYAGDWEHGAALVEKAAEWNPRHPAWYWFPLFYKAYREGDFRGALGVALRINLPQFFMTHAVAAAAYGQLGEREAAGKALRELLALKPDFAATARGVFGTWLDPDLVERLVEGLRKAGLAIEP